LQLTHARRALFLPAAHVTFPQMPLPEDPETRRMLGEQLKSALTFESLVSLIDTLLGEGGCPWDQSRKAAGCPEYMQGELNEVIEALKNGDNANLEEELGDLLFMVAFTAKLAEKEDRMTMKGMFERILNKMVYRHPHVFGGVLSASSPEEVVDNWKELKNREKSGPDRQAQ
jgi:uncharacterized protein YabN with tetrapyrrole methylase and pyrophosphatase domain